MAGREGRRLNVWFINHYATSPYSAGGNRPFSLCKELAARGHQVVLICCTFNHQTRLDEFPDKTWTYGTQDIDGVRFVWVDGPAYEVNDLHRVENMITFTRRVLRLADTGGRLLPPDVVLGSSPHLLTPWAAARVADAYGVPYVLEVRDIWPASIVDIHGMHRANPVVLGLAQLERSVSTRASQIVSVLPGGVDHLVELGVDPDRVTWIPNGVDFTLMPPPTDAPGREPLTLMYAGAHGLANGLGVLIAAAALLEAGDARGRIRWVFIGNGPEKHALIAQAERLALTNVVFEETIPKSAIYTRLADADAFVANVRDEALYRFGVSLNKFFDYMAVARPTIVGMDSPWNPFASNGAGITVRPDDAQAFADGVLELLAMSPTERAEMGARGRAFVQEGHDFHVLGGKLEQVLQRATEQ